ncbi:MAG: stage II sporulation protein R [Clostridiales bacterium]|nr:stage II sporulation protein R [Clostridiales bacterium]
MEKSKNKSLRAWEIAALMALSLALCAGTWAQTRQQNISSALVRLHVIADSDAAEEQEIKLEVRDAVLAYLTPVLEETESQQQARQIIRDNLEGIAQAAGSAARGRQVSVTLSRESYPTREYEGFTLPAGRYESLRVILGRGQGKNWWCVVFPPLCLSAAESEKVQDVLNGEDLSIVTEEEGYVLRFRLVELWGEFLNTVLNAAGG